MNIQRILGWNVAAVCLLLGLLFAPAITTAKVHAAGANCENPATTGVNTTGQDCTDACNDQKCVDVCGSGSDCNMFVNKYINPAIKALSALVGIVAVGSIIYAGIQYSASADDPGIVTKAKQRIFNVVIGLVAYIFLIAFLNYLVPGTIWN